MILKQLNEDLNSLLDLYENENCSDDNIFFRTTTFMKKCHTTVELLLLESRLVEAEHCLNLCDGATPEDRILLVPRQRLTRLEEASGGGDEGQKRVLCLSKEDAGLFLALQKRTMRFRSELMNKQRNTILNKVDMNSFRVNKVTPQVDSSVMFTSNPLRKKILLQYQSYGVSSLTDAGLSRRPNNTAVVAASQKIKDVNDRMNIAACTNLEARDNTTLYELAESRTPVSPVKRGKYAHTTPLDHRHTFDTFHKLPPLVTKYNSVNPSGQKGELGILEEPNMRRAAGKHDMLQQLPPPDEDNKDRYSHHSQLNSEVVPPATTVPLYMQEANANLELFSDEEGFEEEFQSILDKRTKSSISAKGKSFTQLLDVNDVSMFHSSPNRSKSSYRSFVQSPSLYAASSSSGSGFESSISPRGREKLHRLASQHKKAMLMKRQDGLRRNVKERSSKRSFWGSDIFLKRMSSNVASSRIKENDSDIEKSHSTIIPPEEDNGEDRECNSSNSNSRDNIVSHVLKQAHEALENPLGLTRFSLSKAADDNSSIDFSSMFSSRSESDDKYASMEGGISTLCSTRNESVSWYAMPPSFNEEDYTEKVTNQLEDIKRDYLVQKQLVEEESSEMKTKSVHFLRHTVEQLSVASGVPPAESRDHIPSTLSQTRLQLDSNAQVGENKNVDFCWGDEGSNPIKTTTCSPLEVIAAAPIISRASLRATVTEMNSPLKNIESDESISGKQVRAIFFDFYPLVRQLVMSRTDERRRRESRMQQDPEQGKRPTSTLDTPKKNFILESYLDFLPERIEKYYHTVLATRAGNVREQIKQVRKNTQDRIALKMREHVYDFDDCDVKLIPSGEHNEQDNLSILPNPFENDLIDPILPPGSPSSCSGSIFTSRHNVFFLRALPVVPTIADLHQFAGNWTDIPVPQLSHCLSLLVAVCKIQRVWRGYVARQRVAKKRDTILHHIIQQDKKIQAAIILQKSWRKCATVIKRRNANRKVRLESQGKENRDRTEREHGIEDTSSLAPGDVAGRNYTVRKHASIVEEAPVEQYMEEESPLGALHLASGDMINVSMSTIEAVGSLYGIPSTFTEEERSALTRLQKRIAARKIVKLYISFVDENVQHRLAEAQALMNYITGRTSREMVYNRDGTTGEKTLRTGAEASSSWRLPPLDSCTGDVFRKYIEKSEASRHSGDSLFVPWEKVSLRDLQEIKAAKEEVQRQERLAIQQKLKQEEEARIMHEKQQHESVLLLQRVGKGYRGRFWFGQVYWLYNPHGRDVASNVMKEVSNSVTPIKRFVSVSQSRQRINEITMRLGIKPQDDAEVNDGVLLKESNQYLIKKLRERHPAWFTEPSQQELRERSMVVIQAHLRACESADVVFEHYLNSNAAKIQKTWKKYHRQQRTNHNY